MDDERRENEDYSEYPATNTQPEAGPTEALPVEPPVDRPAAPRRRRGGWIWPALAGLLAAAVIFLWVQNLAAAQTVEALTERIPQLLVAPQQPNPLAAQLDLVREEARLGTFPRAAQRARALSLPPSLRPQLPESGADPQVEVSPQAAAFFQQHPELEQRLTAYAEQAREARDRGADVESLRALRAQILQAAHGGDAAQVQLLLERFAAGLQELGVDPRAALVEQEMQQVLAQFQEAFRQAQQQGKDPRPALALIEQAEQASKAGDRPRALQLTRQALEKLQRAPALRRPAPPPRTLPQQIGDRAGQLQQILGMVFMLLQAEDQDLAVISGSVQETLRAHREYNQQQVAELLATAQETLERIRDRREDLGRQLAGDAPPAPEAPAAPPEAPAAVPGPAERLVQLLEEVRRLPQEQYEQARGAILQSLVAQILDWGPPAPTPQPGQPLSAEEVQAARLADERVRAKLRLGHEQVQHLEREGEPDEQAEDLLRQARRMLWDGQLASAEQMVNRALRKLGLLPPEADAASAPQVTPAPELAPAPVADPEAPANGAPASGEAGDRSAGDF